MNTEFSTFWRRLGLSDTASGAPPKAHLVICLPRDPGNQPAEWTLHRPGGNDESGSGPLSQLQSEIPVPRDARIEVWTPPYDTLLTSVSLPTQSRAKLAQALPFALEDQLLGEPDQFQATYRAFPDGRLAVAVTAKERLSAWQQALADAGVTPAVLCPANLRLPWTDGEWSIRFTDDGLWVRSGSFEGFSVVGPGLAPPPIFTAALADARARGAAPKQLRLYGAPAELERDVWNALGVPLVEGACRLCDAPDEAPPFNLLRGLEGDHHPLLNALRPALIIFGLWVGLGFLIHVAEWIHLHHIESRQRAEMVTLFKRSFPQQTEIVDPAVQMDKALTLLRQQSGLVGRNDLLPLLDRVARSVHGGDHLTLHSVTYRNGRMRLSVTVPGFNALDAFKDRLRHNGLAVKVVTADSHGKAVRGRMEVRSRP